MKNNNKINGIMKTNRKQPVKQDPYKSKTYIGSSNIEGKGLFANRKIKKDSEIGTSHIYEQPTFTVGNYHNHSSSPNMYSVMDGDIRKLYAIRDIEPGEELTVDYRQQPELGQPEDFENEVVEEEYKKGGSTPSDSKLYSQVLKEAKKKFKILPSKFAKAWIDAEYKKRGGYYAYSMDWEYGRGGKTPPDADKARDMLVSGTAHGHPLTQRQREYLAGIAGTDENGNYIDEEGNLTDEYGNILEPEYDDSSSDEYERNAGEEAADEYQLGGRTSISNDVQPTDADSSLLLKNALLANAFYKNNPNFVLQPSTKKELETLKEEATRKIGRAHV